MLITREMTLPGIRDYEFIALGQIRQVPHTAYAPPHIPLTFIVGTWQGKLRIPIEAITKAHDPAMTDTYKMIRIDMERMAADARALNRAREKKARKSSTSSTGRSKTPQKKKKPRTVQRVLNSSSSNRGSTSSTPVRGRSLILAEYWQ